VARRCRRSAVALGRPSHREQDLAIGGEEIHAGVRAHDVRDVVEQLEFLEHAKDLVIDVRRPGEREDVEVAVDDHDRQSSEREEPCER
jgi:hypothetical protein